MQRLCENAIAKGPQWLKDALSQEAVGLTRWAARNNKEGLEQAVAELSRSDASMLWPVWLVPPSRRPIYKAFRRLERGSRGLNRTPIPCCFVCFHSAPLKSGSQEINGNHLTLEAL
eukprot:s696_g14.t1